MATIPTRQFDSPKVFAAELLDAAAAGYAGLAADRLLEEHTDIRDRFEPRPRLAWKENLQGRIAELAEAVAAESPNLFAHQVAWSKVAFESRDVPVSDLRASLETLEAVLAEELPAAAIPVLHPYFDAALAAVDATSREDPSHLNVRTPYGRLAAQYVVALLEGDRRRAAEVVVGAVRDGMAPRSAYLHVLLPAQRELGRMWHMNEISVAEEHFVTATTQTVMSQVLALAKSKPPHGKAVLVAAVEGETHDIGLRVIADFFEMDGWRVIYLGASTPIPDLLSGVFDFEVDLVALAATLALRRRAVAAAVRTLRSVDGLSGLKILLGGAAFLGAQEDAQNLGADAFARDAEEAVRLGRALVGLPEEDDDDATA